MPNTDDIRKKLASYKTMLKRQGDFTIYASNYIADVEALLPPVKVAPPAIPSASPAQSGVRRRKKKLEEKSDKSD